MDEILQSLITKTDRDLLVEEIDILKDSLYQKDTKLFQKILDTQIRNSNIEKFRTVIETPDPLSYLEELKAKATAMEVVNLEIAFEPSRGTLLHLKQVIEKMYKKNLLLDISFNPTLIGGAVISYSGKYKDLSLRNEYAKSFEKHIKTVFNEYA